MKKIFLILSFLSCQFLMQAKVVRFAVNMTGWTFNPTELTMISDFQALKGLGLDFQPGQIYMSQSSNPDIYYYSIDLPAFQKFEYTFAIGTTYDLEFVPVESRASNISDYRWVYVDSTNTDTLKMPEVFFGGNNTATDTLVRMKVNMVYQSISPNGVHVAGDFQGNNPATSRMYSFGGTIYEYMAYMNTGMQHFRFYNGNTAANVEVVNGGCTMGVYRMITVTNAVVLDTVCFNSCSVICAPASILNVNKDVQASIFPNPMLNETTINFNEMGGHKVILTDMYGKIVQRYMNIHSSSLKISRGQMANGMYMVEITNDKGQKSTQKILLN